MTNHPNRSNHQQAKYLTDEQCRGRAMTTKRVKLQAREVCFACVKPLTTPFDVFTSDPQLQHVGRDCYGKIRASGKKGYQPPLGGPRLFQYLWMAEKAAVDTAR